jgi:hypothetical protein
LGLQWHLPCQFLISPGYIESRPSERILLIVTYTPITAANGDTNTTLDVASLQPLNTPNARLIGKGRRVLCPGAKSIPVVPTPQSTSQIARSCSENHLWKGG